MLNAAPAPTAYSCDHCHRRDVLGMGFTRERHSPCSLDWARGSSVTVNSDGFTMCKYRYASKREPYFKPKIVSFSHPS